MKIAIDSDIYGIELKKILIQYLSEIKYEMTDLSYLDMHDQATYPDIAINLAVAIRKKQFERGILICGTGQGMAMCANKVQGIFAGTCSDVYSAERLVKSNDAQILCLGALVIGPELAKSIVNAWTHSDFQAGRSLPKVERMREIDKENFHLFNNK
jgi:ribose 5-phosphate isomerase B